MINRLFYWFTHTHKWEVYREGVIVNEHRAAVGNWYHLRCKECGVLKKKNLKA